MLPHIGLIFLSCTYVLIGAVVFFYLERPNEYAMRDSRRRLIEQQRSLIYTQFVDRRRSLAHAVQQQRTTRSSTRLFDYEWMGGSGGGDG